MVVGEEWMNYKRVKVEFQLANAIIPVIRMKVKDHGVMKFEVRYENIPHFCFVCGRIGHTERECLEEAGSEGGVRFGTALRCSPQKRDAGKLITIPEGGSVAKRGLNFSGQQKSKVMATASSSHVPPKGNASSGQRRGRDGGMKNNEAAAVELAKGVASMSVQGSKERVSGLNSYEGSSMSAGKGDTKPKEYVSMCDRLMLARRPEMGGGHRGGQTETQYGACRC